MDNHRASRVAGRGSGPGRLDRRALARRWHSVIYKRRRGPLDWLRRTAWFVRTSVGYRVILVLTLLGLVLSVASLVVSSSLWLVVGLVSLVASLVAFVIDWAAKSREGAALYATRVPPVAHPYDAPYDRWRHLSLPGRAPGLRYHPDLDEQLRREQPTIAVEVGETWRPTGPAAEVWRRWGGRRGQFVERKIRLGTDLLPGSTSVRLDKTDYVAYIVTNSLADQVIRDKRLSLPELGFADVGLRLGRIPTLERSGCSNHIGGDLLLVGDGVLWLHQQNHRNLVQPGALALSASGSFDWDLDLAGAHDLVTVVKNGLLRELEEELHLPLGEVPHEDVRIVRYGRATYTGGKPQFLAVARTRATSLARRRGRGDAYVEDVLPVDVEPGVGLEGIASALEVEAAKHREASRPLLLMISTLRQLAAAGDPLERWLRYAEDDPV